MQALHKLLAGYTITATAGDKPASISQVEDAAIGAVLQPSQSRSFGPYLVERNFKVDGATVVLAVSAAALSFGGLLCPFAGTPVDALQSTLAVNPAGDDNALTFTARAYGAGGDGISIQYLDPGGVTAALSVSVVGSAIIVSLARAASAITSTAADVLAAIEASIPATKLVSVSILTSDSGSADDGSGVVTAMARTVLASGAGSFVGTALPGCLCIDVTNGLLYRNSGTQAAPVWQELGDAA